jgi:GH35 family endo-1,4-beta-xylanase
LLDGVNRRAFLRTAAVTSAILWSAPAWCGEAEDRPPSDPELLSEANASIERHRKSDVTVQVQNAKGEPLRHAEVKIEQVGHETLFGCNLFSFDRCSDPEKENAYRDQFAALFNYCTLGFYWAAYESTRGKPSYDYTDRVLEWTKKQGITCKGHPLVWDHPAGSPGWLPEDPGELASLVTGRVKQIVSRYRGRINFWDVVNEATHLPQVANRTKMAAWGATLGSVSYTAEPLRVAREANPDATLLVNDYRTDAPYFELLSRLREHGRALFDAIGIQSHMHSGVWPLHKLYQLCERYSKLRVPIDFTETTILSGALEKAPETWGPTTAAKEAAQAEQAAQFYTMLFAYPAVQAVTWWDFSDYHAWQQAPAGLVRQDMSPKPVYERLRKLLKGDWWTRTSLKTDEQGTCSTRAFHGLHQVTAQNANHQITTGHLLAGRGKSNHIILRL